MNEADIRKHLETEILMLAYDAETPSGLKIEVQNYIIHTTPTTEDTRILSDLCDFGLKHNVENFKIQTFDPKVYEEIEKQMTQRKKYLVTIDDMDELSSDEGRKVNELCIFMRRLREKREKNYMIIGTTSQKLPSKLYKGYRFALMILG